MNKKILLAMVASVFLITIITALTLQQNQEADIKIVCINAGYCSSTTVCNISIFAPDQTLLVSSLRGTQAADLGSFNFTINSTLTSQIGEYIVGGFCVDGSVTNVIDFTFDVTPSGAEKISDGEGSSLFAIVIILIILTIFFIIGTIFIQNIPFKVFLGSMSALMLVATIGFGVTIMQQLFGANTFLVDSYTLFFRVLVIMLGGAGAGLILYLVVVSLTAFNKNRGLKE